MNFYFLIFESCLVYLTPPPAQKKMRLFLTNPFFRLLNQLEILCLRVTTKEGVYTCGHSLVLKLKVNTEYRHPGGGGLCPTSGFDQRWRLNLRT